jgi:polyferredoxin
MDKMNYPRGLIRYTTEHAIQHQRYHLLRPRTIVYSLILVLLVGAMVGAMLLRKPVIMDVMRDRNALYRDVGRRGIENDYTLRIVNKQNVDRQYRLRASGLEGLALNAPALIPVPAESVYTLPVSVTVPHEHAEGGHNIEFVLEDAADPSQSVVEESRFRGPDDED